MFLDISCVWRNIIILFNMWRVQWGETKWFRNGENSPASLYSVSSLSTLFKEYGGNPPIYITPLSCFYEVIAHIFKSMQFWMWIYYSKVKKKTICIKEMKTVIAGSNFFFIFKELLCVINFPQKKISWWNCFPILSSHTDK